MIAPDAFWPRVRRSRGCWVWAGGTSKGHGVVEVDGRRVAAHRIAWTLARGVIPPGHLILQECGNGLCVRPGHLWAATPRAHAQEVLSRLSAAAAVLMFGRPGSRNGRAKLTQAGVVMLKRRVGAGAGVRALARELLLSPSTVSRAAAGRRWRDS